MPSELCIRPVVLIPLKNRGAFLETYFHQGDLGGLFTAGSLHLAAGQEVDLEIAFAEEGMVVHSRGVVRWKRLVATRVLPAGIGVEFLPEEKRTRDLLLDFAKGRSVRLYKRKSRRYPVVIEVEYATDSIFITEVTEDLSKDGAFIRTQGAGEMMPEVGTRFQLVLRPPEHPRGIRLAAEVVWRRTQGTPGVGVRFLEEAGAVQEELNELIEAIRQTLARDRGPDGTR